MTEKIGHIFQGVVFTIYVRDYDKTLTPHYTPKQGDKSFICQFISPRGKFGFNGVLTDELWKDPERNRVLDMLSEATWAAYTRVSDKRG